MHRPSEAATAGCNDLSPSPAVGGKIWVRSPRAIGWCIVSSARYRPIRSPWPMKELKAYSNTYELVHRREVETPNAIWQADHTPLDILLVRPVLDAAKPRLTVVLDDYSRAVAGVFSFVRGSLRPAHVPGIAPGDLAQRGFTPDCVRPVGCSVHRSWKLLHLAPFWSRWSADLKIQLVFSLPGKPRGPCGCIERFFSTVNEMFLCELDGYAPCRRCCPRRAVLTLVELQYQTAADALPGCVPPARASETEDTAG